MSMYERSNNKTDEEEIATHAAERWGLTPVKSPIFCVVDGLFLKDGQPYAFFEIKNRNIALSRVGSVFIDKAKLDRAFRGAKRMKCNLLLIFQFTDGRYFCPITEPPRFDVKIGGPAKRRDDYDRDEVYLIPSANWQTL